jgi:hypothetical protein
VILFPDDHTAFLKWFFAANHCRQNHESVHGKWFKRSLPLPNMRTQGLGLHPTSMVHGGFRCNPHAVHEVAVLKPPPVPKGSVFAAHSAQELGD